MTFLSRALVCSTIFCIDAIAEQSNLKKDLPIPGQVFLVENRTAFVIPAKNVPMPGPKPWVWYAPTLPNLPSRDELWMFERFLDAGISIAGIDVGESYGSPEGNRLYSALYAELTGTRGYSTKPVLLGRSRGGLMTLSWASEHPQQVGAFAGIYPVSNLASYPGISKAASAFQLTPEQLESRIKDFNPIDRLTALAPAGVPLFAIHGDDDKVVPLDANSGLLKSRYSTLGGSMELIVPHGQGHNMWPGFFQSQELVAFVKAHAGLGLVIDSPCDYQVIQRRSKSEGLLKISGLLVGPNVKNIQFEYRLLKNDADGKWNTLSVSIEEGRYHAEVIAPTGGWFRLEVRIKSEEKIVGAASVAHVGVGEVFVVAGQSNSANFGEQRQKTISQQVSSFDGKYWRLANDPQPGAEGEGGSFMPPLGDALAERFGVPVGFVACGAGGTSVREWLPQGVTFPNPPTIERYVRKSNGDLWESRGELFDNLCSRMKSLGLNGFRAVLWHQGESDAHQKDATRTLSGTLYRDYLAQIIKDSHREIAWNAPWFVAQVSYHAPDDSSSIDIRNAQALLWRESIALEGPDTDALTGAFRDEAGKGVHFSATGLREHANRWFEKIAPWLDSQIKR
ncbi:prolyl oligopeptidase family serine peptidase [bacterium]|nr:prolyl oligopeptidase family serine peptidase [bacterium]